MMITMPNTLNYFIFISTLSLSMSVWSYDLDDLTKLNNTKVCLDCNLNNIKLSNKVLINSNLNNSSI